MEFDLWLVTVKLGRDGIGRDREGRRRGGEEKFRGNHFKCGLRGFYQSRYESVRWCHFPAAKKRVFSLKGGRRLVRFYACWSTVLQGSEMHGTRVVKRPASFG